MRPRRLKPAVPTVTPTAAEPWYPTADQAYFGGQAPVVTDQTGDIRTINPCKTNRTVLNAKCKNKKGECTATVKIKKGKAGCFVQICVGDQCLEQVLNKKGKTKAKFKGTACGGRFEVVAVFEDGQLIESEVDCP